MLSLHLELSFHVLRPQTLIAGSLSDEIGGRHWGGANVVPAALHRRESQEAQCVASKYVGWTSVSVLDQFASRFGLILQAHDALQHRDKFLGLVRPVHPDVVVPFFRLAQVVLARG